MGITNERRSLRLNRARTKTCLSLTYSAFLPYLSILSVSSIASQNISSDTTCFEHFKKIVLKMSQLSISFAGKYERVIYRPAIEDITH